MNYQFIRKISLLVFCILFSQLCLERMYAQSAYVGEKLFLSPPSVFGTLDAAAWYCSNSQVSVTGGTGGATVEFLSYFSGTATIECKYGYSYYVGTTRKHNTGTSYYTVSCKASRLTLNKSEVTLKIGQEIELEYSNQSGYSLPYASWVTSDKKVANFENYERVNGEKKVVVTAAGVGQCVITCQGNTGYENPTCTVTVTADPPTGIAISPEKLTLREDETGMFTYTLTPSNAYTKVTWSSSNESVAMVNSSGKVTAVAEGTATVSVSTDNGFSSSATVEVVPLPTRISLPETVKITIGYPYSIKPTLYPLNAVSKYTWETSDNKIVVIDESGRVRGKAEGTANVTVTTENGHTSTCKIVVQAPKEGMDSRNAKVRVDALLNLVNKSLKRIK